MIIIASYGKTLTSDGEYQSYIDVVFPTGERRSIAVDDDVIEALSLRSFADEEETPPEVRDGHERVPEPPDDAPGVDREREAGAEPPKKRFSMLELLKQAKTDTREVKEATPVEEVPDKLVKDLPDGDFLHFPG